MGRWRIRPGLLLVLVLGLTACQSPLARVLGQARVGSQDPDVQVFFNHNPQAHYRDPVHGVERAGDNLEAVLVEAIGSARRRIDVAVHELRLPGIAAALAERQRAGVSVRVILEDRYRQPWSLRTEADIARMDRREQQRLEQYRRLADRNGDGQLSEAEAIAGDAVRQLEAAGIPIRDDRAGGGGSGLMHHKFVIVDDHLLLTGSANFTASDIHGDAGVPASRGNANNLLRIESPALAALFRQQFETMWGQNGLLPRFGPQKPSEPARTVQVGRTAVTVFFDPVDPLLGWEGSGNGLIGEWLATMKRSADLALFVFSEQRLADILGDRHRQGATVRILVEPQFAWRPYSELLDVMGLQLRDRRCRQEAGNHLWQPPLRTAGTPRLPDGDLLHHKFAVLDGETVITGSHNWSSSAADRNDETLLILRNPALAARYEQEFERLYREADLGPNRRLQRLLARTAARCDRSTP